MEGKFCKKEEIIKQMNDYKNTLFHFTKLQCAVEILSMSKLRFGKLKDMNDLAEANLSILSDWANIEEQDTASIELGKYQILSFTQDYFNYRGYERTSLWGYYSEKGMGACIVLNKQELISAFNRLDIPRKHHRHIDYHKRLTGTNFLNRNRKYGVAQDIWRNKVSLFFKKHIGWRHEKEYRFVIQTVNETYVDISNAIKGIIICTLDSNAADIQETKRYKALKSVCREIPILCYQQHFGNNDLVCYECMDSCPIDYKGEIEV